MLKKIMLITTLLVSTCTFAETCPTVANLKNSDLHGWQAMDIEGDGPVSNRVFNDFRDKVDHFALAEWMSDAPEGAAHCYYQGKAGDDYLDIYFAKQNLVAADSNDWQKVRSDIKQCKASLDNCEFQVG